MLLENYISSRLEFEARLDRKKSRSYGNLPKTLCLEIPTTARLLPPRVPIYHYSISCSSNHSSLTADSTSNSVQSKFKPILSKFPFSQTAKSLYNNLLPKLTNYSKQSNSLSLFDPPHRFNDNLLNEVSFL